MLKRLRQLSLALSVLTVAVSSAAAASSPPPGESLSDLIKRVKRAVAVVTTYDCRGEPLLHGNGFFIEPGYLVTGLHVLEGACSAQIKTFDGRTYPVRGVAAANERRDLALLRAVTPSSRVTILPVEEALPHEGEEVIVVSHPRGDWKISRGSVVAIWDFQNVGEVIRITPSISPGASGGPVINRQGRVVGVALMQVKSSEELNFAVPGESVSTLKQTGPRRALVSLAGARPGR